MTKRRSAEEVEGGSSDEQLLERARAGDARAFEAIYRAYAGRVVRHLRVLLGPTADVEDALQQTFVAAHRNLRKFEGRSKLSTWLLGIATRVSKNSMRSRGRRSRAMISLKHEESTGAGSSPSPESRAAARTKLRRLQGFLDELPADKRIAFVLYFVEQRPIAEVAEIVGDNPAATWARIKRARNAISKAMDREERKRT